MTTPTPGTSRLVDHDHEPYDAMAPYPWLVPPRIGAHRDHTASRSNFDGEEFCLDKRDMSADDGTYIGAPFDRFRDRPDRSQIPLALLVGLPDVLVDRMGAPNRGLAPHLEPDGLEGAAVLIRAGWDRRWASDASWEPGPYLSVGFVDLLVTRGIALLNVEFWNVDDTTTRRGPVDTRLLDAGTLVVEHLYRPVDLPPGGFRFSAPVVRIRQGASFPVRAFVEVPA